MHSIKDLFYIAILAIIALVDSSWAVCQSGEWWISKGSSVSCQNGRDCIAWGSTALCSDLHGTCNTSLCTIYQSNDYFYTNPKKNSGGALCNNSNGSCYWTTITQQCIYQTRCSSQRELDSLICVNDGKIWDVDPVTGVTSCVEEVSCNWTVSTIPRLRCLDVPASGQIVCKDNECSGLPYSMWWSEFRIDSTSTRCGNISHVHTSDTSYTFGTSCESDQERCSEEKKCYSEGGTFYIVQECAVGRPVVGNDGVSEKTVPYIVSAGKGSCSEMGYRNENYKNGSGVGNQNATQGTPPPIDDDCIVYGIGCPEPDTTNYKEPPNQNPTKCYCEPFDGLNSMSKITCPDGTVSIYYFSCKEWENFFVSSSAVSQSSSSAPPASSGDASSSPSGGSSSDTFGQYPQYPEQDGAYKKNVQGALSGSASLLSDIKSILGSIKEYLFSDNMTFGEGDLNETPTDSSTFDTTSVNYVDSLYSVLDSAKSPIDTSLKAQSGVCPIISANFGTACRFIPGLAQNNNANMQINTSDIGGINVCAIIRALILAFSSVVSFIIGARLFRQINIT